MEKGALCPCILQLFSEAVPMVNCRVIILYGKNNIFVGFPHNVVICYSINPILA